MQSAARGNPWTAVLHFRASGVQLACGPEHSQKPHPKVRPARPKANRHGTPPQLRRAPHKAASRPPGCLPHRPSSQGPGFLLVSRSCLWGWGRARGLTSPGRRNIRRPPSGNVDGPSGSAPALAIRPGTTGTTALMGIARKAIASAMEVAHDEAR